MTLKTCTYEKLARGWNEQRITRELTELCAGRERFPSKREFKQAGRYPLFRAVVATGGASEWAPRMGLPVTGAGRKPTPGSANSRKRHLRGVRDQLDGQWTIFNVHLGILDYRGPALCSVRLAVRAATSLDDLALEICEVFGREDTGHLWLYETPDGQRLYTAVDGGYAHPAEILTDEHTVASLNLESGQTLHHLFDFGDQWTHRLRVVRMELSDAAQLEHAEPHADVIVLRRTGQPPAQDEGWTTFDEQPAFAYA